MVDNMVLGHNIIYSIDTSLSWSPWHCVSIEVETVSHNQDGMDDTMDGHAATREVLQKRESSSRDEVTMGDLSPVLTALLLLQMIRLGFDARILS
jgi:hypothetical protein